MEIAALVLFGVFVGSVGTLIGAGGGFIMLPVFLIVFKDRQPVVLTAMSLAVITLNAFSGTIAYARMKRIDYRAGILFALAALPGSFFGVLAVRHISIKTFNLLFGIFMVLVSAWLFFNAAGRHAGDREPTAIPRYNVWKGMSISVGVGFLSSIMGIGGGLVHVPMMVYVLGFPVHFATATSHFVLSITSFAATCMHIHEGNLRNEWHVVLPIAAGVIVGAQFGAVLSRRFKSIWIIKILSIALAIAGLRVAFQAW
jgi:uncharacterized membrane protein YfcA